MGKKFGYDVSVLRPSVHSLELMEGNQVSARRGEGYVINRAMYLYNPRFSCGKSRKKWCGQVVAFKNLFTLETCFLGF